MAVDLPDIPRVEAAIVAGTNVFRAEQGLAAVTPNAALTAAARVYATFLARSGKFAHEADGQTHAARAKANGYAACLSTENLALNADSRGFAVDQLAGDAIEGWKNSPGHRKNMVLPLVTEIGVAVAKAPGELPKYLSVQMLGRPLSLQFSYKIENRSDHSLSYRAAGETVAIEPRMTMTHTTCTPDPVEFALPGKSWLSAATPLRLDVQAGDRLTIQRDGAGALRIVREPLAREGAVLPRAGRWEIAAMLPVGSTRFPSGLRALCWQRRRR